MCPRVCDRASLSLSFFIYKMGTISVLTKLQVVRRTSLTASPEDREKAFEGWLRLG